MPSSDSIIVSDSDIQEPIIQTFHLIWIVGKQVQISAIHVTSAKIIVNIDDSQGILGLLKRRVSL